MKTNPKNKGVVLSVIILAFSIIVVAACYIRPTGQCYEGLHCADCEVKCENGHSNDGSVRDLGTRRMCKTAYSQMGNVECPNDYSNGKCTYKCGFKCGGQNLCSEFFCFKPIEEKSHEGSYHQFLSGEDCMGGPNPYE